MSIAQNTALFSLIGTFYGGNGIQTFALPNLQGMAPVHQGPGFVIGQTGGSDVATLTPNHLPAHTHAVNATTNKGNKAGPAGSLPAADAAGITAEYSSAAGNTTMNPAMIAPTGSGQPFSIQNPYLVLNYIIALAGIFPSRS
jgi:microcystin-dependent protein